MKFLCDQNLGRLSKWLRLIGFDAMYMHFWDDDMVKNALSSHRVVLTRAHNKELTDGYMVIRDDKINLQLKQVINALDLKGKAKPFSRCSICNEPLYPIGREEAKGYVPEYVFLTQDTFSKCPRCSRTYWKGTHISRTLEIINTLGIR